MTPHALELIANDHGWGHMAGWGGGWMWGVAVLALIVVMIVWLARSIPGSGRAERSDTSGRARAILSERYARGELSTEEYRERLSELP